MTACNQECRFSAVLSGPCLSGSLLDTLHLVLSDGGDGPLRQCLTSAYNSPVPADGDSLHFKLPDGTVSPLHTPVFGPLAPLFRGSALTPPVSRAFTRI